MADKNASGRRNYDEDKAKLKAFLAEFFEDENGAKKFVYAVQLARLAQREQVALTVNVEDLRSFDVDLASAVESNARRYATLLSDAVAEMLPDFRGDSQPPARDALDVYINHRWAF